MPNDTGGLAHFRNCREKILQKNDDDEEREECEERQERAYLTLVSKLENQIETGKLRIQAAQDPSSYAGEMTPLAISYTKNGKERQIISQEISTNTKWLEKLKCRIYDYILSIYNKLQYGNAIEDIFTASRLSVNDRLMEICPEAIKKFISVYDNMDSENSEDWANAVHSCRRILSDLADSLYTPTEVPLVVAGRTIKLGKDQYVNRLVQYITSKSESKTYQSIVGADLRSIGERIDAVNDAVCKGTHTDISKDEASRYLIHTYLLISDIVNLI